MKQVASRSDGVSGVARAWLFGVPAAVLVIAWVGVCVLVGTAWPWTSVVHEDGVRSMLGTIFFFEHAARELLPDVVLAMAVAGAVRWHFPFDEARGRGGVANRWRTALATVTAATVTIILVGTAATAGVSAIFDNLLQLHTRAGAPLVWGAHWRYHLLERLAQILLAFSVSGVFWIFAQRPVGRGATSRPRLYLGALVLFVVATAVFRPTLEPFGDPTFLGHQLRELFTHVLVTLPLALGVCFNLAHKFSSATGGHSGRSLWPIVVVGAASIGCGAFLLAASLASDAQSQGQVTGLAALIFPHFFEHALGYVLVPALAGLLYMWPGSAGGESVSVADASHDLTPPLRPS